MTTVARKKRTPVKRPSNVVFENTAAGAIVRLSLHVSKYPEYLDRDRDMILLHIVKTLEELKSRP